MTTEAQVVESHCHLQGTGSVFVKPGIGTSPGRVLGNRSPLPEHRAWAWEGTRGDSHSQARAFQPTEHIASRVIVWLMDQGWVHGFLPGLAGLNRRGCMSPEGPECLYLCEPSLPCNPEQPFPDPSLGSGSVLPPSTWLSFVHWAAGVKLVPATPPASCHLLPCF